MTSLAPNTVREVNTDHYLLECDSIRKVFSTIQNARDYAEFYLNNHGQDGCFIRLDRVSMTIDRRVERLGDFQVLSYPIKAR